jgi:hypothetical protein
MDGIEDIYYKKRLIAKVFRANLPIDGVQFFTDELNPFQIGAHKRKKGVSLQPHVHLMEKPVTINVIQELLFVQSGKIQVTIYTTKGRVITSKILTSGDSILLMEEGHGVEFLEDSRIFEVKQGPYPGTTHAKLYLQ